MGGCVCVLMCSVVQFKREREREREILLLSKSVGNPSSIIWLYYGICRIDVYCLDPSLNGSSCVFECLSGIRWPPVVVMRIIAVLGEPSFGIHCIELTLFMQSDVV